MGNVIILMGMTQTNLLLEHLKFHFHFHFPKTSGKCSGSGRPMGKDVIRNSRRSLKCVCPAKFQFDAELGVIFNNDHNNLCTEFQIKAYAMKILQSPEKHKEFESRKHKVTRLSDSGPGSSNVSQILEKEITKKSYPLIQNENIPPPPTFVESIINPAKKKIHSTINPKDEVNRLIEYLQKNDMKHSVLQDERGCVTAVSCY